MNTLKVNFQRAGILCGVCGLLHEPIEKEKYAGIDDAGDDQTAWEYYTLNGRCVIARRLKADEIKRPEMKFPRWLIR